MRRIPPALVVMTLACGVTGPSDPNIPLGLYVWSVATPAVLSIRDTVTALDIQVQVVNPTGKPIILNPVGEESFRIGRPGNLSNAGPGVDWEASATDTFLPHRGMYAEYKVTMKVWRAGGWPTDTGTYTVRSYYDGQEGMSTTFRLVP